MKNISLYKITSASDASFLIRKWCRKFRGDIETATTMEDLLKAKKAADIAFGIRSFAVELLLSEFAPSHGFYITHELSKLVARAGMEHRNSEELTQIIDAIGAHWQGLAGSLSWILCGPEKRFDFLKWRYEKPQVSIVRPRTMSAAKNEDLENLLASCKSESQQLALRALAAAESATTQYDGQLGDLELRRAAWIVGPSGSGKTWVARQFGKLIGRPVYQTTVASWSIRNSKSDISTIQKILEHLEHGPTTVIVDEICKIRQGAEQGNGNWYRAVQDEIMSLSTGSLQDFSPSQSALTNLRQSWIIYAGAFQDLYRKKLGAEVMLAEQVEDLTLSYEEIAEAGWLPDELINRMGSFIECRPPTSSELCSAMEAIEISAGIKISNKTRNAKAHEAVVRMQGFRGLEAFAMQCAQVGAVEREREKGKKKQPPSSSENSADWF